jgi:hypothetical protein
LHSNVRAGAPLALNRNRALCLRGLILTFVMSVFGVRKVPTNTLPRPSTATHSAPDAHETSPRFASSTSVVRHAEAPPLGLVAVTTLPPLSATHSDRVGHETPPNAKGGARRILHAALPPVGLVDVTTWFALMAQNAGEGQDTPNMKETTPGRIRTRTRAVFHAEGPPRGRVELTTALPTATQSGPETHETLDRSWPVGMTFQALAPPVGFAALAIPSPKRLTVTQSR